MGGNSGAIETQTAKPAGYVVGISGGTGKANLNHAIPADQETKRVQGVTAQGGLPFVQDWGIGVCGTEALRTIAPWDSRTGVYRKDFDCPMCLDLLKRPKG